MTIDRRKLYAHISRTSTEVREKVRALLIATNVYDEADGVDLLSLPEETVATLYRIVHGHVRKPERRPNDHVLMSAYRERLLRRLGAEEYRDYMYLSAHPGRYGPSESLRKRVLGCRTNQWHIVSPFYVRPARHHGMDVGLGLFAMIPLFKGQLLAQFTGRLHRMRTKKETDQWYKKNTGRENYAMRITHGAHSYVVNPLDQEDRFVIANNYAAYINEPSLPPWKVGDTVQITESRRNGIARKYDFEDGVYTIEFADGAHAEYLADELNSHPDRPSHQHLSYRANCFWVDFPVPLHDLYTFSRTRSGVEHQYIFRRRDGVHDCRVTYSHEELVKTFDVYSDTTAFFTITPTRTKLLKVGDVVVLKQTMFVGLDRVGEVVEIQKDGVAVYHTVADHTRWRLPRRVFVGKVENKRCAACKEKDDNPSCSACTLIPFPCIHACSDIRADEELLCYYSPETVRTRGLRCETSLEHDALGPSWAV